MKIEITADGFDAGTELLQFSRCCAGFELGTQRNQIASVDIHLSHANEQQQSKNKRCLVQVHLHARSKVIAEVMDSDLNVAIFRALERAGWTLTRRLQRKQHENGNMPIIEHHVASHYEPDRAA